MRSTFLTAERRLTLEALADVDAGRVVSQAEVERWAAGLGIRRAPRIRRAREER